MLKALREMQGIKIGDNTIIVERANDKPNSKGNNNANNHLQKHSGGGRGQSHGGDAYAMRHGGVPPQIPECVIVLLGSGQQQYGDHVAQRVSHEVGCRVRSRFRNQQRIGDVISAVEKEALSTASL